MPLINTEYFTELTAQVNLCTGCAELQAVVDEAFAPLADQYAAIQAQLAVLSPILALLTAPTNPTEVITWVTNFITDVLTPQYLPYINYATQITELLTAVSDLETAINNAAAKFTSCSITIPPIT